MATIRVKGHLFEAFVVKNASNRRMVQFKNAIVATLKKVGVPEDQTDIPLEGFALKKQPASVTWFVNGHRLYYSYGAGRFVENLYVVSMVIAFEVELLLSGAKSEEEFIGEFREEEDVEAQRKEARDVLGLGHETNDLEVINKRYKELAKEHHPDTATGNVEKFKAINHAHKMLKRELA